MHLLTSSDLMASLCTFFKKIPFLDFQLIIEKYYETKKIKIYFLYITFDDTWGHKN